MTVQETNEVRELTIAEADAVGGGKTDVIKAMGNSNPYGDDVLPSLLLWLIGL